MFSIFARTNRLQIQFLLNLNSITAFSLDWIVLFIYFSRRRRKKGAKNTLSVIACDHDERRKYKNT